MTLFRILSDIAEIVFFEINKIIIDIAEIFNQVPTLGLICISAIKVFAFINAIISGFNLYALNINLFPLSRILFVNTFLTANRDNPIFEIYYQKARDKALYWTFIEQYILYKGRLIIPITDNLRIRVIEELYIYIVIIYPGKSKIRRLISAKY